MSARKVAVIVGSLRKASFSRKIARALITQAPPSLACRIIEIGDLALYNEDLDADPPAQWKRFREQISPADGVLFVSPEYNRGIPGVLKNAIDVGSRPSRKGALNGKPGAVVSVSPGSIGGFGANQHLRQSLVFLDVPTLQQPEAYVGGADKLFDAAGQLTNDSTREFLRTFISAFAAWIELNLAGKK